MKDWKKLLYFSLPMTLIGIIDLLIVITDLFWIYFFSDSLEPISGIRISLAVLLLTEGIAVGLVSALLIYISQNLGAQKLENVRDGIQAAFTSSWISGLIIGGLGFVLSDLLLGVFGSNIRILGYGKEYLNISFIGYVFIILNTFLLMLPRYFQNLKLAFKGMTITLVLNALLTPLLIFTNDSLNDNVVTVTAISTVVANIICSCYLIYKVFFKDSFDLKLSLRYIRIGFKGEIFKKTKGFVSSQIINGLVFNTSAFLYILIISYYPSDALNIYAIGSYVFVFFGVFSQNFTSSIIPLIAEYKGKQDVMGIKELVKKYVIIVSIYTSIISLIVIFSKDSISSLLGTTISESNYVNIFLLSYAIPWIFSSLSMIFILVLAGSGDSLGGLILTITNMYILVLLCLSIIPRLFQDQIIGVFVSIGIIQLLSFACSITYYLLGRWKKVDLVDRSQREEGMEA